MCASTTKPGVFGRYLVFSVVLALFAGCSSKVVLMPTPNLYVRGGVDPFPNVPPEFQNNHVDVFYFTDRVPDGKSKKLTYGSGRSRSVAFGVAEVDFGKNISWADLNKASRTRKRSVDLPITVQSTKELVRLPPTPRNILPLKPPATAPLGGIVLLGDEQDEEKDADEEIVRHELSQRLKLTPVKEVYLFVHGYNCGFENSTYTIAGLWHFFGRQGVPIAYSWPAGGAGLLRGYSYDSASSEFTVYHLKQVIRLIASCPDVQKINIIAHSRGTDTTINALRELHMEINGSAHNTRDVLKLGTVVLAAPDVDVDVVIQKFATVRLGQVPERFAMYICGNDKALSLSSWLFDGMQRLGKLKANVFTPEELEFLRKSTRLQIIDARVSDAGFLGHDYFQSNPAVSSDLILLMRYKLSPGAENGRPLRVDKKGFWVIDDKYPDETAPPILDEESK